MPTQSLTIDQVVTLLAETPPRLSALTADMTPAQLATPPEPGTWSASDVLAHLRACADVWGEAIATMLAEDHPRLRAVDPRRWIEESGYRDLDFRFSLQAFASQRSGLMTTLAPLPDIDWSRAAILKGGRSPVERTVYYFAEMMARHEQTHLKQLSRIVEAMKVQ